MKHSRIPPDAFAFYLALGPQRSYLQVAQHYGVSKQSIVKVATRENWQNRLTEAEKQIAVRGEERASESLEAMNERHLKTLRVIQHRALEALKQTPLTAAMDAVRALDIALRQERVVRGEPGERTEVAIGQVIAQEYARWMKTNTAPIAEESHVAST